MVKPAFQLEFTMRLGRPKKPLTLTDDERQTLQQWARRPKSAQRLALRSRIVLACADGKSNTQVAQDLHIALPPTGAVGAWPKRRVCRKRPLSASGTPSVCNPIAARPSNCPPILSLSRR